MKIYFCDVCNESIPLEELEQKRVTSVRGKMICARCVPQIAPAAGAPAPAAAATGGGGAKVLAFLALVVGAGGLYLAWDAKGRLDRTSDPAPRLAAAEHALDLARGETTRLQEALRAQGETLARVSGEPAKLREELTAELSRIEAIERSIGALNTVLGNVGADREKVEKMGVVQDRIERELHDVGGALGALKDKVALLAAQPSAAPAPNGAAPAAKDAPAALDDETKRLLGEFASKDPSVRWSALDRLAKRRDPSLLPYFLPMLEDSDPFVQFRAISAARDLSAKSAVGRLIKLLRDGDAIVRGEALDALVTLTGNALRYDAENGAPAEREKGAKAWDEWFEKNKARFEEPTAANG